MDPAAPLSSDVMARLKAAAGEGGWSDDPDRLAGKLTEWRGRWTGTTPLLLSPRDTAAVARIVAACAATRTAITPQGGNTGLVGGQIPSGEVLLSLERMTAVRALDADDDALVVEAGATLARVQDAADAAGRRFPLSLASEGSATIGGLVSTNAGGVAVLRYGTMRSLVLGLEAVLPDGRVWNGLKRLRKDNTGYDLKQLLIGAEGTLGVVTAASLRLYPRLAEHATALAGVADPAAAVALLSRVKAATGGAVEAFELMSRAGVQLAGKNLGLRDPLPGAPWLVLVEVATAAPGQAAAMVEGALAAALEAGLVLDAALAQSEAQAAAFWAVREGQSAAQKAEGQAWKHDIAVPVAEVARFIAEGTAAVAAISPRARVVAFGHVGDGNIHFDVLQPRADGGEDAAALASRHAAQRDAAAGAVHDIAVRLGGSISAEHGLGVMKTAEALRYKPPVEVEAMRAVRRALDPLRIMNPRVLF